MTCHVSQVNSMHSLAWFAQSIDIVLPKIQVLSDSVHWQKPENQYVQHFFIK